ncbi:hypothetical protein PR202_gb01448 [Eleusine coracana subsp. coracana]|uniref:peptidylprolyl isomerase n=1 Tax=Eleusine coracana subsp. coracana TaxID=191504 RepID=A0AAV5DWB0_ELECO|nr:hypothetical protein PR202_gb01448 [Eleusine coracana subsp. coracana]
MTARSPSRAESSLLPLGPSSRPAPLLPFRPARIKRVARLYDELDPSRACTASFVFVPWRRAPMNKARAGCAFARRGNGREASRGRRSQPKATAAAAARAARGASPPVREAGPGAVRAALHRAPLRHHAGVLAGQLLIDLRMPRILGRIWIATRNFLLCRSALSTNQSGSPQTDSFPSSRRKARSPNPASTALYRNRKVGPRNLAPQAKHTRAMAETIDLTGDGGVLKAVVRKAKDDATAPSDSLPLVDVHYEGSLAETGEVFDTTHEDNSIFSFEVGQGAVIKAWDIALRTMKVGEVAKITCKPEYAYGSAGAPPEIPPKYLSCFNFYLCSATLIFEVELLACRPRKGSSLGSVSEEKARLEELKKQRELAAATKEEEKRKREEAKAAAAARVQAKLDAKKGKGKGKGK